LSILARLWHRVETYRDVTSVPTFFVRTLGPSNQMHASSNLPSRWRLTLNLLSTRSWSFFARSPEKKWVHENVIFRSVYNGQLRLCMSLLCAYDSIRHTLIWFLLNDAAVCF
jgi:hypothetical protein